MEVVSHAVLAELHPTAHHPETPRRIEAVLGALDGWTDAVPATDEQVERCHTAEHLARIRAVSEETWLDGDTPASATSYEAALLAAGGAIQAAATGGFAVVRPPGHHAPTAALGQGAERAGDRLASLPCATSRSSGARTRSASAPSTGCCSSSSGRCSARASRPRA